ncbi:UNVERIFIED_CONTAM: hypothetical protein Slati_2945000 [Sesamum latifolium]|uniref:Reverse transcriptase RNase H-like domain-containing protein n=1 Tax=Sesamum latifolium TaxID=2727402 RepID=A0AAW2VEQ6_9LAMI
MPIYYVSKLLNGAEGRYTPIEKIALALVVTARKLRPYFLTQPVGVKTNMPLKQTLGKPDTFGRLIKWAVELSEYDISYLPRTTIKAQALADFISEVGGAPPKETPKEEKWLLHVDGSSTIQGSGAGIVITSPQGEDLEFTIKFGFKASNNEAEYEVLVAGMRMAHEATLAIQAISSPTDWRTPIIEWIEKGSLLTIGGTPPDSKPAQFVSSYKEESFTKSPIHTLFFDVCLKLKEFTYSEKYTVDVADHM